MFVRKLNKKEELKINNKLECIKNMFFWYFCDMVLTLQLTVFVKQVHVVYSFCKICRKYDQYQS